MPLAKIGHMQNKIFRIGGPIDPERHYFVPHRLDWEVMHRLIRNCEYFVLHAPRQSGKTTAILEFCRHLSSEGMYNPLYINVETAQAAREHVEQGLLAILDILLYAIKNQLT
jgi:predicted AAA+ superfamily ATPase